MSERERAESYIQRCREGGREGGRERERAESYIQGCREGVREGERERESRELHTGLSSSSEALEEFICSMMVFKSCSILRS